MQGKHIMSGIWLVYNYSLSWVMNIFVIPNNLLDSNFHSLQMEFRRSYLWSDSSSNHLTCAIQLIRLVIQVSISCVAFDLRYSIDWAIYYACHFDRYAWCDAQFKTIMYYFMSSIWLALFNWLDSLLKDCQFSWQYFEMYNSNHAREHIICGIWLALLSFLLSW